MANWCENTLTIQGDSKEMTKFYDFVGEDFKESFSMGKLCSVPENLKDDSDWLEENWGCISDMDNMKVNVGNTKLVAEYETAWAPNHNFIIRLGEKFPHLKFELIYAEGGCFFGGAITVENGESFCFTPELLQIYFVNELSSEKYEFVVHYDKASKFMTCNYVLIGGLEWETICSVKGYNKGNVSNWEMLEVYMKTIIYNTFN